MTRVPLDREAIAASARALASSDSISGHLNNALQILEICGFDTSVSGEEYTTYDAETLRQIYTRVLAALELVTVIPAAKVRTAPALVEGRDVNSFTVTEEGRKALAEPASVDLEREV